MKKTLAADGDHTFIVLLAIAVCVVALLAIGCGGGGAAGGGAGNPAGPSTPTPPPAPAATTVNIVGSAGNGAFTPNPVQVPSGGSIIWRNNTNTPHVLVMNDGTSIGSLAPGASITTTLSGNGGDYRCTTHPSMVGSINGTAAPEPPADPGDGY